ncbi:MATE family efflux transporter [Eubacterium callanderi]|uniref:Probable multidrug resistance protein NorM n=1 Tax=Eubacterium callanderi TaxID=53442 RepID=A0A853JIL2_9FIRM|nr:MATE family efflux transporter [Eubacterium callanderi]
MNLGETSKVRLFSNRDLFYLFLPLIIEQMLEFITGLADSIMVSYVGEAAVSGVSLVDFIMQFLISLFAALATGGAVVAGQYLGSKHQKEAKEAANQLVWFAGGFALIVMVLVYLFQRPIFHLLFGQIEADVYRHSYSYMMVVAASIPFLAIYNAGAAVFRTQGNAKLPMQIMFAMNIVNILGNAVMVYGFQMGTLGVAIPTLISRIGAAVLVMFWAIRPENPLQIQKTLRHHVNGQLIRQILGIGAPYGLENGMFYFGRLLILSLVSSFGTASIAANSVAQTLVNFEVLPGLAIGLGLTVVISRCMGSGDIEQSKYYTKKVVGIIYVVQTVVCLSLIALMPVIMGIYGLSAEATRLVWILVIAHAVMEIIWPLGYTLPVTFRASGDAKFPMAVSMSSMIVCRILMAYVISYLFDWGLIGVWAAMFLDWIVKAVIFTWRYFSMKWAKYSVIK